MPYRAAMSSLFLQFAYLYLNSIEGVSAIRVVYNYAEDCVEILDKGITLRDIDLLILSLPYELNYFYVVRALKAMNIPLASRDRTRPLIVAGGVAPAANPLPLIDIVDAVAVGDAEPLLPPILSAVEELADGKRRALEALSDVEGIVTKITVECMDIKRKNVVLDLDKAPHPVFQVVPLDEKPVYGNGFRLEVSRGCARMCPFCMESRVMHPFRFRSLRALTAILDRVEELREIYGSRIVIYSLSLLDTPIAKNLLRKIVERGYSGSIPSMRPEHLGDQEVLELAKSLGQRTLTIAPESPIPSVARALGKSFDIESLANHCIHAYRMGFEHVKMYFIYGAANETPSQFVTHFSKFLKELSKQGIDVSRFIEVGINPLIPKPWTCFELLPPIYVLKLESELERVRDELRRCGTKPSIYSARLSFVQSAIALGGEEISKYIVRSALEPSPIRSFITEVLSKKPRYIECGWDDPPWRRVLDLGIAPCIYAFMDELQKRIIDGASTRRRFST